ncbi:MAG: SIMPL domain-containing protein [Anaerolineales bacterium]|nr:SIMPL domain-containing protein [Anaerolineales bacterium]
MSRTRLWMPIAVAAGLILTACSALGTSSTTPDTLSVTGTGVVVVPPDIVTLTLGVQTRGAEIGSAVAENNLLAGRVMQALSEAGVAPEDMQTTYFNVYTQPKYDEFGNPTGEQIYFVDNTLTAVLRDPAKLGDALQQALTAGANSVQGVVYGVDDLTPALDEARRLAIADAQRQAEQMAAAAGVTLGEVYTVSDTTGGPVPYYEAMVGGKGGAAAGVPTAPGSLTYQVQVGLSYILP